MTNKLDINFLRDCVNQADRAATARGGNRNYYFEDKVKENLNALDELEAETQSDPLKAKIILLEQELHQAQSTASFLHDCLMNKPEDQPQVSYGYPEQTLSYLEKWHSLAPAGPSCFHSHHAKGCKSCEDHLIRSKERTWALKILGLDRDYNSI